MSDKQNILHTSRLCNFIFVVGMIVSLYGVIFAGAFESEKSQVIFVLVSFILSSSMGGCGVWLRSKVRKLEPAKEKVVERRQNSLFTDKGIKVYILLLCLVCVFIYFTIGSGLEWILSPVLLVLLVLLFARVVAVLFR